MGKRNCHRQYFPLIRIRQSRWRNRNETVGHPLNNDESFQEKRQVYMSWDKDMSITYIVLLSMNYWHTTHSCHIRIMCNCCYIRFNRFKVILDSMFFPVTWHILGCEKIFFHQWIVSAPVHMISIWSKVTFYVFFTSSRHALKPILWKNTTKNEVLFKTEYLSASTRVPDVAEIRMIPFCYKR